ncbi:MAG: AAA family ATPase, partial [Thermoplasmatota archaeon]
MHFKNIYLRDFGIFSNQELSDLGEGIIVIGGSNRAGKTTFLQALRYLGYGLPQDDSIPPATDEYYLASEVVTHSGDLYSLTLNGYAQPKLSQKWGTGPEITSPIKLYNDLDRFTYQQIFTISLAELQKIPAEIKNNKEKNRLYSILLGAGLTEIIKLPEIARSYFEQAKAIGGKRGNPDVAEFKRYHTHIQDAMQDKKSALEQVDSYIYKQEEIERLEQREEKTKQKIAGLSVQQVRLDVLKNNYADYDELKDLETQINEDTGRDFLEDRFSQEEKQQALRLKEEYYRQQEEFKDLKADFQSEILDENWLEIKDSLLKQKGEIENYLAQLSGIREK